MKNLKRTLLVSFCLLAITSCTTILPVAVSDAEVGSKSGMSESTVLFGSIYLNKEFGIKDAAENGNITSAIATVDMKTKSYLIFQKKTLIVTAK